MAIGHLTAFLIAQAATLPTWELERSVDPITDSGLVTLTMKEGDGELLIGCQSVRGHGYYLMVVKGPRFLGNFDQREVILRFDHSTPMHRLWHYRDAMAATEHAEDVIICAVEDDPFDANYELLQDNLRRLQTMTDVDGRAFEIVTLPMPGVVGGASTDKRNLDRLPASYANFYIANSVVLAPIFGHPNDAHALETLGRVFADRRVVGINCEPLVWGMGTIHCVTQQQPQT